MKLRLPIETSPGALTSTRNRLSLVFRNRLSLVLFLLLGSNACSPLDADQVRELNNRLADGAQMDRTPDRGDGVINDIQPESGLDATETSDSTMVEERTDSTADTLVTDTGDGSMATDATQDTSFTDASDSAIDAETNSDVIADATDESITLDAATDTSVLDTNDSALDVETDFDVIVDATDESSTSDAATDTSVTDITDSMTDMDSGIFDVADSMTADTSEVGTTVDARTDTGMSDVADTGSDVARPQCVFINYRRSTGAHDVIANFVPGQEPYYMIFGQFSPAISGLTVMSWTAPGVAIPNPSVSFATNWVTRTTAPFLSSYIDSTANGALFVLFDPTEFRVRNGGRGYTGIERLTLVLSDGSTRSCGACNPNADAGRCDPVTNPPGVLPVL